MVPQRAMYAAGGAAGAVIWLQLDKHVFAPEEEAAPAPEFTEPGASLHEGRTTRFGLPGRENLRFRQSYVASVNYERRIPNWVAEHLRQGAGAGPGERKKSRFAADASVPPAFRSDNGDFLGSGWSRGHMAPCGAHKDSQRDMDETFALSSNILPQDPSNNGSDWLRLERFARKLPSREHPEVFVVSGPLFLPEGALEEAKAEWRAAEVKAAAEAAAAEAKAALPKAAAEEAEAAAPAAAAAAASAGDDPNAAALVKKKKVWPPKKVRVVSYPVLGEGGVAVPTHLFKVLLAVDAAGVPRGLSTFVMANAPATDAPALEGFVVPLEFVERYSGLQFFDRLDEVRALIPPLCGGSEGKPCAVKCDARIMGWKVLGKLQASTSCAQLRRAWGEVNALSADLEKDFRGLGQFERAHAKAKKKLGCTDDKKKA